jgi:hypothetical protein
MWRGAIRSTVKQHWLKKQAVCGRGSASAGKRRSHRTHPSSIVPHVLRYDAKGRNSHPGELAGCLHIARFPSVGVLKRAVHFLLNNHCNGSLLMVLFRTYRSDRLAGRTICALLSCEPMANKSRGQLTGPVEHLDAYCLGHSPRRPFA